MKKLYLLIIVVLAITLSAQAQKKSKEEKDLHKPAKQEQAASEVMELMKNTRFQFNPSDVEEKTRGNMKLF